MTGARRSDAHVFENRKISIYAMRHKEYRLRGSDWSNMDQGTSTNTTGMREGGNIHSFMTGMRIGNRTHSFIHGWAVTIDATPEGKI